MRVHRAGGNKGRALWILVEIAAWHTWLKLPAGLWLPLVQDQASCRDEMARGEGCTDSDHEEDGACHVYLVCQDAALR